MSMVYLEEIIKVIGNKYLAINIATQRARQLNEKGIPILNLSSRKPASVALEELVDGKIGYHELDPHSETTDDVSIFQSVADDAEGAAGNIGDFQPVEVFVDDTNSVDPDETEEGL